MAVKHKGWWHF